MLRLLLLTLVLGLGLLALPGCGRGTEEEIPKNPTTPGRVPGK
jgi:hypothetical protein